jgi:hypothetical protein
VIKPLTDTWEKGEIAYQEYIKIDETPIDVAGGGKCKRCYRFFKDGEGVEYTFGKGSVTKVCKVCYGKLTNKQGTLTNGK